MTKWIVPALTVALAWPISLASQDPTAAELARGVREAQRGDFEAAVATLDAVAKRLVEEGGRAKELSRAYVYLSIAYLGLSQEQKAKAQFLEALKMDSSMELSAREFPPRVLQFFQEVMKDERNAATTTPTPPQSSSTPRPAQASSKEKKGGASKGVLIGLGVAAAVGGGIAVAGGKGGHEPTPPATTTPPATGTFAILSASPSMGATISLPSDPGAGSHSPTLEFQFSYPRDLSLGPGAFVITLLRGTTECLATQVAYATRLDRSDSVYIANSIARFRTGFWVIRTVSGGTGSRCGQSFTTDQLRFQTADFQQTLGMSWVFVTR